MTRTALEMTREEWKAYRPRSRRAPESRRRERALLIARQAAALLRADFGATRVVLFGSATQPERFGQWSDIDLATWGVPAERFYQAVAAVTALSGEIEVDLVDVDTARPALRSEIDRGVEL